MNKIFVIAKKEFLDIFRDKRTLMRMILIPLIAFPVILKLVSVVQTSQDKKQATEEFNVGYVLNGQSKKMIEEMGKDKLYVFESYEDSVVLRTAVKNKTLHLGLNFSPTFDIDIEMGNQGTIELVYRGADNEDRKRFEKLLAHQDSVIIKSRLMSLGKDMTYIQPLHIIENDQSTLKEIIGKYGGGMLPYIFMAFLFMGSMLPAIDLFAGEKERGTIETLLTSPVNRVQILLGKMIVVVSFGLMSATIALVSLFGSLQLMDVDSEMLAVINEILSPQLIIMLFVLLIPLAIFFAGVMIPVSIYSKSFKEAQSILTPLNIVMIMPAMAGFFPGVELDYTTAFIPIVNVVLATKSLIAGDTDIILLAITFVSLILLAGIAVMVSFKQFGKEGSILR